MPRPLRVFLCHASQDKPAVRKLHRYLKQRGVQPWLDEIDLLPGENWEVEIPNAIDNSDVILVCLSRNSINKEGYVQKEITFALDKALEKPEGTIFVIPVRLELCEVPNRLNRYQWVDLFRPDGNKRLLMGLNKRAIGLGADVTSLLMPDETRSKPIPKVVFSQPEPDNHELQKAEQEAREKAEREAAEKKARERRELEVQENAGQEKAEREAAEIATRAKAEQETREEAEREAAEEKAKREAPSSSPRGSHSGVLGEGRDEVKPVQKKPYTKLLTPSSLFPEARSHPSGVFAEKLVAWFSGAVTTVKNWGTNLISGKYRRSSGRGPWPQKWMPTFAVLVVPILLVGGFFLFRAQLTTHRTGIYLTSDSTGQSQIYYYKDRELTPITSEAQGGENWMPAPDGFGNLYFVSNRDGRTNIYVLNNQEGVKQVTGLGDATESWSPAPDGAGNLYFVSDRSGKSQIYVLNKDGSNPVTPLEGEWENWSPAPDGLGNLYFVSDRSGKSQIYVLNRDGVTPVTDLEGSGENWSPAPDGLGNLYFVSNRHGRTNIYIIEAGLGVKQVTGLESTTESWSPRPDGWGNLYFTSDRNGALQVFRPSQKDGTQAITDAAFSSWLGYPDRK